VYNGETLFWMMILSRAFAYTSATGRKFDMSESCSKHWKKKRKVLYFVIGHQGAISEQKAKFP
jgi:hypothetical protein